MAPDANRPHGEPPMERAIAPAGASRGLRLRASVIARTGHRDVPLAPCSELPLDLPSTSKAPTPTTPSSAAESRPKYGVCSEDAKAARADACVADTTPTDTSKASPGGGNDTFGGGQRHLGGGPTTGLQDGLASSSSEQLSGHAGRPYLPGSTRRQRQLIGDGCRLSRS